MFEFELAMWRDRSKQWNDFTIFFWLFIRSCKWGLLRILQRRRITFWYKWSLAKFRFKGRDKPIQHFIQHDRKSWIGLTRPYNFTREIKNGGRKLKIVISRVR